MPLQVSEDTIHRLIDITKRAGKVIMDVYATNFEVDYKSDESPVTLADQRADDLIVAALQNEIDLDVPIVSEESFAKSEPIDLNGPFWLVDPLDGTKQFINKRDEFTVNIGLIEDHHPIFGVIHAPALDVTYWGGPDGAFRQAGDGAPEKLSVRPKPADGIAAVVSRSHLTPETGTFLESFTVAEEVSSGSSIKFCQVAEGTADLYPRYGPTSEWDTAAGHAVVEAAGGHVLHLDGRRFDYGRETLRNPFFIVCSDDMKADVLAAIS